MEYRELKEYYLKDWEPIMFDLWHKFTFEERLLMAEALPSKSMAALALTRISKVLIAVGRTKSHMPLYVDKNFQIYKKLRTIYIERKI